MIDERMIDERMIDERMIDERMIDERMMIPSKDGDKNGLSFPADSGRGVRRAWGTGPVGCAAPGFLTLR